MIKLHICAVGKLKEAFWRDAVEEYRKRIRKYGSLTVTEVGEAPDNGPSHANAQKSAEAEQILKKCKGYTVLLDLAGKSLTSEEFAEILQDKSVNGVSEFTFIIGGSRGVSETVRNSADLVVSFGRVTYPHQLMRVILAEQLYRALTILHHTGYHK
ncbi:MAG: 23S rRNA (pseudouridine(1915)-N(3))-methyltransferase RlmH [Clostridia bacterium]|nr:23S rRNA (pseudouridine(1915)-N(3))-methyltransferase RlmH [Clostridia bacterium]